MLFNNKMQRKKSLQERSGWPTNRIRREWGPAERNGKCGLAQEYLQYCSSHAELSLGRDLCWWPVPGSCQHLILYLRVSRWNSSHEGRLLKLQSATTQSNQWAADHCERRGHRSTDSGVTVHPSLLPFIFIRLKIHNSGCVRSNSKPETKELV